MYENLNLNNTYSNQDASRYSLHFFVTNVNEIIIAHPQPWINILWLPIKLKRMLKKDL